jgi:hypothetical protein
VVSLLQLAILGRQALLLLNLLHDHGYSVAFLLAKGLACAFRCH